MKQNMGFADKFIRILVAFTIGILYFTNIITGTWAVVLIVLAVVFVITSFIGVCPLYAPFRISTKKK